MSLFLVILPLFHIPIKGSLFISTMSRNLAQAPMLAILILMPIIFLSGAWTPPDAMPVGLRQAMYLSPLYYFIEMSYGILLKGQACRFYWTRCLISLCLAVEFSLSDYVSFGGNFTGNVEVAAIKKQLAHLYGEARSLH